MASADTEREIRSGENVGSAGLSSFGSVALYASLRSCLREQALAEKDRKEAVERLGGFGKQARVGETPPLYITGRAPTPPPCEEEALQDVLKEEERRERVLEAKFPSASATFRLISETEVRDFSSSAKKNNEEKGAATPSKSILLFPNAKRERRPTRSKKRIWGKSKDTSETVSSSSAEETACDCEQTEDLVEAAIDHLARQEISSRKRRKREVALCNDSTQVPADTKPIVPLALDRVQEGAAPEDVTDDDDRREERALSLLFTAGCDTSPNVDTQSRGFNPYIF